MSRIIELRERKIATSKTLKSLLDTADTAGRGLNEAESAEWDKLVSSLDDLDVDIARQERALKASREVEALEAIDRGQILDTETRDGKPGETKDPEAEYRTAFGGYLRGGREALTPEQRALLTTRHVDLSGEQRAQGVATGAAGGYTVPQGFRATIVETLKFFGGVRPVSEVITTDSGQTLPWPTNDDTSNVGAILAENTQITQQDVTLGTAQLGAYMYTSKLILVSWQLLQDTAFDFETWLAKKIGQRIGRIQNTHFTTGTGTAQPLGVQTNATIGKTGLAGQTLTVIYDDLVDLIFSVDAAYRASGRCRFMLNDASLGKIRKIKDSQNRPLWEPSMQANVPETLLGYGLTTNNDMPVMAVSAKSILFGDFYTAYVIRDVMGIQTVRLDERYADFLQVGFFGFARTDATLQDGGAIRAYANSAT